MSAEVRYEVGGYLAEQLDAFEALIGQRDQARGIAVELEGECAKLTDERDAALLAGDDNLHQLSNWALAKRDQDEPTPRSRRINRDYDRGYRMAMEDAARMARACIGDLSVLRDRGQS